MRELGRAIGAAIVDVVVPAAQDALVALIEALRAEAESDSRIMAVFDPSDLSDGQMESLRNLLPKARMWRWLGPNPTEVGDVPES